MCSGLLGLSLLPMRPSSAESRTLVPVQIELVLAADGCTAVQSIAKALNMVSVQAETVPAADEQPSTSRVDENEQARWFCGVRWRIIVPVLPQQPEQG